jgi:hypothetical protein
LIDVSTGILICGWIVLVQGWEKTLGDSVELQGVLYYDCPEEVLTERILARGKTSGAYEQRVSTVLIRMLVRSVR